MTGRPLGVVVPAHQAEAELGPCLDALFDAGFAPDDIVVVDDGSRDQTGAVAHRRGVTVLRHETAQRPAKARNAGAEAHEAKTILFVDADVTVHPDVRARLVAHFADPELAAVFGSYDAAPPALGVVSRYRNLLHHFTHQKSRRNATTFWTGLGAVRRHLFLELGGFDCAWEDIEDVEFGLRLSENGHRVRLDPQMMGTHLKRWTWRSMLRTDYYGRALPWSRLLKLRRFQTGDLVIRSSTKLAAAALLVCLASLAVALFWPVVLPVVPVAFLAFLAADGGFWLFLLRNRGLGFTLKAIPCHILFYAAALAGYLRVALFERNSRQLAKQRRRTNLGRVESTAENHFR